MIAFESWHAAIAAAVAVAAACYILSRRRARHPLVVTAKRNWPFIGHTLDFLPDNLLRTAADFPKLYGDFVEFFILSQRGLLVTDATIAKEVMALTPKRFRRLRSFDYATGVNGVNAGLFHVNGPLWKKIRKATSTSFSNRNVSMKLPSVLAEVQAWIQRLEERSDYPIDMKSESMSLTLRVITVVAFGLGVQDPFVRYFLSQAFLEDILDVFTFSIQHMQFPFPLWVWRLTPMYKYEQRAVIAAARFTDHCAAVLEHKKQLLQEHQPSCMIDHLIVLEQSKEALDDEEIIANVKTFYMAGAETTSISITWACYFLAMHPEVVKKVRAEVNAMDELDLEHIRGMQYTNAVMKEVLRLTAPAFMLGFEPEDGVDLVELSNGIKVHQGDVVWINFDGMMAKEQVYADALQFNPDRWLLGEDQQTHAQAQEEHWLPFGYGPRVCLGMTLALTEAALAVAMLAKHFDMALACPVEEVQRIIVFAATTNKMPIKFTKVTPK